MNTDLRINESDIYKWFSIFRPDGKVTEIRCIDKRGKSWSGYFKTPESVIEALKDNPDLLKGNVFQTFNAVHEGCYERIQKNKFLLGVKSTSDDDILSRDWVFIDIDPIRPSDTNATDEQVQYAINVARRVVKFLTVEGFHEPVVVASANGAHIYLRTEMPNDKECKKLCENFIKVMCSLFNDDVVKIDSVIFNASRFAKLPGTMSGKGLPESTTHPQRWCRFLKVPNVIEISGRDLFEAVVNKHLPELPKPTFDKYGKREKFDLQNFMQEHGIEVRQEVRTDLGVRYILDHCVFNPEHKGKDAMIFQYKDGSIAYKCFHDSCSQYTWRDVRLKYEPDAYDRRDYEDYSYNRNTREPIKPEFVPEKETEDKGHKWMSPNEIRAVSADSLTRIATGIRSLDEKIGGGILLHNLSVLTGPPASGKTSLFATILLESIQMGYKSAVFSNGTPSHFLKDRILLTAAGMENIRSLDKIPDVYAVKEDAEGKILDWLNPNLLIRNSAYKAEYEQLKIDITDVIALGAQNIILDNVVTVNANRGDRSIEGYGDFIKFLCDKTRECDIHIWISACSLNYGQGNNGGNEFYAIADNILTIRRVDRDFRKFTPREIVEEVEIAGFTNIVEIVKNQFPGLHTGEYCGLYHETATKRMTGSRESGVRYGWELRNDEQFEVPTYESTPPPPPIPTQDISPNTDFDNENQMWYNKEQDDDIDF